MGTTPDPVAYLAMHGAAVRWGSLNRRLMTARVAHALSAEPTEPTVNQCHDLVEAVKTHRDVLRLVLQPGLLTLAALRLDAMRD